MSGRRPTPPPSGREPAAREPYKPYEFKWERVNEPPTREQCESASAVLSYLIERVYDQVQWDITDMEKARNRVDMFADRKGSGRPDDP